MTKEVATTSNEVAVVKEKNLIWSQRIANAMPSWRDYLKAERQQYRTDVKALLCRGNMTEDEINRI